MVSQELLVAYVKDALADLYDPVHLQKHPLAEILGLEHAPGTTIGEALRQLLRQAIEALRPDPSLPISRPEWLGYRLLSMRYLQGLDQATICREIGFSQASFYRRHQEALEALASILWERHLRNPAGERETASALEIRSASERATEEAVRLAKASQRCCVDLNTLVHSVEETITPLARERGITLRIEAPPSSMPPTYGDPGMLRQILINLLSEALRLGTQRQREMVLAVASGRPPSSATKAAIWSLRGFGERHDAFEALEEMPGIAVSRALLGEYGGELWFERDEHRAPVLFFALPLVNSRSILIVDDDPDTIELYQRYLQDHQYTVRVASNPAQLDAELAEVHPDLILLDVLMPQWDGWAILQKLKARPETAPIPVVICSVLSQPQLALALGAAQVLQKPILERDLLRAIEETLATRDTVA